MGKGKKSKIYACDGRLGTMRPKGNMTPIEQVDPTSNQCESNR
jgi:hypothetical protein